MNLFACDICPRACGANRRHAPGRCGGGSTMQVARAAPHHWEEPCISGAKGSGTVFFAGCGLGCIFCQNHEISRGYTGQGVGVPQLAEMFLQLQGQGVHNLNLVTGTHYAPWVVCALQAAKQRGLALPVVWNSGGYETQQTLEYLAPFVDVWLMDLKFYSAQLSGRLTGAPDYFEVAGRALQHVCAAAGPPQLDEDGMLRRGVVVRVLALPGHSGDAEQLLHWMAESLPKDGFLLSLMSQYTPPEGAVLPKELMRRLSSYEYKKLAALVQHLGFAGYTQHKSSATQCYLPRFGEG